MHDTRVVWFGALSGLVVGSALAGAAGMNGSVGLLAGQLEIGGAARLVVHLVVSTLTGGAVGWLCRPFATRGAATLGAGAVAGLLLWLVGPLSIPSLAVEAPPLWSTALVADAFPALVAFVLVGAGTGLGTSLLVHLVPGRDDETGGIVQRTPTRVVILGGGFGGTAAAQRLQQHFKTDTDVELTLISADNALLFTPMLAEVAGGALEPHHISAPLRAAAPGVVVRRGTATGIDTDHKLVRYRPTGGDVESLAYDHLVLAVGAVANLRDLPGLDEHAFTMKRLSDAVGLRRHVLRMLERADTETDMAERRRLLAFVVAGAGFAGTETAAELLDLVRSVLRFYPSLRADEPRVVLVHSRSRILPEIGDQLADFALHRLHRRGIEFVLGARVAAADGHEVRLTMKGDGDTPDTERVIQTRTLVWTAGNRPNPLLADAGLASTRAGAAGVDETLRVAGHDGVWAVGDCAAVPVSGPLRDSEGDAYPPTAQHASRQGAACADNIAAVVRGAPPRPFRHRSLGTLVALGHRTAVAEIRGLRFSGFVAWVMWRAVYLAKLPGVEKKTRVGLDWLLELFFPRDITVVDDEPEP